MDVGLRLRQIISTITKISPERIETSDDLIEKHGVDSMQRIEIVIALEKEFGVQINDDEVPSLRTLLDFVNLVESKRKGIQS